MNNTEYIVTIGDYTRSFVDYNAAREWFSANFMFGLSWKFVKYVNGKLAAAY